MPEGVSMNVAKELRFKISLSGPVVDRSMDKCTFKAKDRCSRLHIRN